MNNTYADFLLQLIEQLFAEDEIRQGNLCYLCNTLNSPMITSVIPSPNRWKECNAEYIKMLLASIQRLLDQEYKAQIKEARESTSNYWPSKILTLKNILGRRYPDTTNLGRRVEWLQDLAKYHKARGTTRTFHETRNWLHI